MKIHTDMTNFQDYLHDESRLPGQAESISFPRSPEEAAAILQAMDRAELPITVQGARTGIAGGAVPAGGHIMNLSRMDRITGLRRSGDDGAYLLTVQPGVRLSSLREALQEKAFDTAHWSPASLETLDTFKQEPAWFFPPDPTEPSASLGGMAAVNASGACSYHYGATREYITGLEILLPPGDRLFLKRGEQRATGGEFRLQTESRVINGTLPRLHMPRVKNTCGYFIKEEMDLVDLFIGSEGSLGIILALELRLLPRPREVWGLTTFFPTEPRALDFVASLRETPPGIPGPVALEYFNPHSLQLLAEARQQNPAFRAIPAIPPGHTAAVYLEYHGDAPAPLEKALTRLSGLLESCGGNEAQTWMAMEPGEMRPLTFFRHAVPELVNLKIDRLRQRHPGLTKLGTDMAVPADRLSEVMEMYNRDLAEAGLDSVIFGHIGDNHLHVNILPGTPEEYTRGRQLYYQWARRVASRGGSVSAEHGIGKLKTDFLTLMYAAAGREEMRRLKQLFDPAGRLNPGNLFAREGTGGP